LFARRLDGQGMLTFAFDVPGGVVLAGPLTRSVSTDECPQPSGTTTFMQDYTVSLTREAPGLVAQKIGARVELAAHASDGLLSPSRTAAANFTATAAPYFLVEPLVREKLISVSSDNGTVTIELTNRGNVRTRVVATAETPQGTMDGGEIVLDSPYAISPGGSSFGNLHLTFHPPPGGWGKISGTIHLTASAADQPAFVSPNPLTANVLFSNDGPNDSRSSPGVPPLLFALVVVAVAIVLRRRR
jgi:MYXO-CTERM domain-containing protein